MKTKRNLIRNCLLGVAIILSATAAIPCRAQTLTDALDAPGLVWTDNGAWTVGILSTAHDGVSCAMDSLSLFSGTSSSYIQTVVTGPALVSFWWNQTFSSSQYQMISPMITLYVDGRSVANNYSANYGWSQATIALSSGPHTLQWNHVVMASSDYTGSAYLDQVVVTPVNAPLITVQPQGQTVSGGTNATFTAQAIGAVPLTYQWQCSSTNLPGATNLSLTITNVQPQNGGTYVLVVSNSYGTGISSNAVLTVPATPFLYTTNNGSIMITGYIGSGGPVTIPDTLNGLPVTRIGSQAFYYQSSMTSVTIGKSVTNIENYAFFYCTSLTGIYFQGNAPSLGGSSVLYGDNKATVYYLPGITGWGATFGGRPTALWLLPNPLILANGPGFGLQTNGFAFTISWATNVAVVVEASTNLASHTWQPVQTNTLTGGTSYFSDPQWTNYPGRFYRLRSP